MLFGGRSISPLATKNRSPIKQASTIRSPVRPEYKREEKTSTFSKAQLKTK